MERFFEVLAQYHSQKAAAHYGEAARLSSQGELEGVEGELGQANILLGQAKGVRRIQASLIAELNELGIEQLPLEYYLEKLGVSQTTISLPKETQETQDELPAPPVAGEHAEIKAARIPGKDLGERQEKLAYALFELKADRTGFMHESFEDACRMAYADTLQGIENPKAKNNRLKLAILSGATARSNMFEKIRRIATKPDDIPPYLGGFYNWVKAQPEYQNLTIEELIGVIKREIAFENLRQTVDSVGTVNTPEGSSEVDSLEEKEEVDSKFDKAEAFFIARRIDKLDDGAAATEAGIDLKPDDRNEIRVMVQRFSTEQSVPEDERQLKATVISKLGIFIGDKKRVLLHNGDEDIQYLLALLSGFDSEEKIRNFFK